MFTFHMFFIGAFLGSALTMMTSRQFAGTPAPIASIVTVLVGAAVMGVLAYAQY